MDAYIYGLRLNIAIEPQTSKNEEGIRDHMKKKTERKIKDNYRDDVVMMQKLFLQNK